MKIPSALSFFALGLPVLVSAVDFNSFNDPGCNGFQEHYHLNRGSKGNLAAGRKSFQITVPEGGCHLKFYTGLNQAPNDGSTMSFTTETNGVCYWITTGTVFRSFGFYCP